MSRLRSYASPSHTGTLHQIDEFDSHELHAWANLTKQRGLALDEGRNAPARRRQSKVNQNGSLLLGKVKTTNATNDKTRQSSKRQMVTSEKLSVRPQHIFNSWRDFLSWQLYIGTMPWVEPQLFRIRDSRLRWILLFMVSIMRSIGLVMHANNPASGCILFIGLLATEWQAALHGILGSIIGIQTANILQLPQSAIRAGVFGYSGFLTGLAMSAYTADNSRLVVPVVVMAALSTVVMASLGRILVRVGLPSSHMAYNVCALLWLFAAPSFPYFNLDTEHLSPASTNADTSMDYSAADIWQGFAASLSQVFLTSDPYLSIAVLLALLLCSPTLAFFAVMGSVSGTLVAAWPLGVSPSQIRSGMSAFNSVLICQTLGGLYFVLSHRVIALTLFASIVTVVTHQALYISWQALPPLSLPFTIGTWVFCLLAGSTPGLVYVHPVFVSVPEEHLRRFRLSGLLRARFSFLKPLFSMLRASGASDDLSVEELRHLEATFEPMLLCAHAQRNDMAALRKLLQEGANISSVDYDGRSALHVAASQGWHDLCSMLLGEYSAEANQVDVFGSTPLSDAFTNGHINLLPLLASHGARLSLTSDADNDWGFLMCGFAYQNDGLSLQSLLMCGLPASSTDYDARTPLHLAAAMGHLELTRWLVEEAGAATHLRDVFGRTPLDDAIFHDQQEVVEFLREFDQATKQQKQPADDVRRLTDAFANTDVQKKHLLEDNATMTFLPTPSPLPADSSSPAPFPDLPVQSPADVKSSVSLAPPEVALRIDPSTRRSGVTGSAWDDGQVLPRQSIMTTVSRPARSNLPVRSGADSTSIVVAPVKRIRTVALPRSTEDDLLPAVFITAASQGDVVQMSHLLDEFPSLRYDATDYDFRSAAHIAAAAGDVATIRWLCELTEADEQAAAGSASAVKYPAGSDADTPGSPSGTAGDTTPPSSAAAPSIDSNAFLKRQWLTSLDRWGVSPLEEACRHGHIGVVDILKPFLAVLPPRYTVTPPSSTPLIDGAPMCDPTSSSTAVSLPRIPPARLGGPGEPILPHIVQGVSQWRLRLRVCQLASRGDATALSALYAAGILSPTLSYADYDSRTPMHLAASQGHLAVVQELLSLKYAHAFAKDRWGATPLDEARRHQQHLIVKALSKYAAATTQMATLPSSPNAVEERELPINHKRRTAPTQIRLPEKIQQKVEV